MMHVSNLIANLEYSVFNALCICPFLNYFKHRVRVEDKLMSLVWAFSVFMVQYNNVVGKKEAQSLLLCSPLIYCCQNHSVWDYLMLRDAMHWINHNELANSCSS